MLWMSVTWLGLRLNPFVLVIFHMLSIVVDLHAHFLMALDRAFKNWKRRMHISNKSLLSGEYHGKGTICFGCTCSEPCYNITNVLVVVAIQFNWGWLSAIRFHYRISLTVKKAYVQLRDTILPLSEMWLIAKRAMSLVKEYMPFLTSWTRILKFQVLKIKQHVIWQDLFEKRFSWSKVSN